MTSLFLILAGLVAGALCLVPRGPEDLNRDRLQAELWLSGRQF